MPWFCWRRRRRREREKFGFGVKMRRNPEIRGKISDPTAEIDPPKQKLRFAVDRSIGP